VLRGDGDGESPAVLEERTLRSALEHHGDESKQGATLRSALEQEHGHDHSNDGEKRGYLGDDEALSADAARKQANKYFNKQIHTALKLKARHNLRRKGFNARQARNDLNDFFNTLGLTESHEDDHARVDVHEKRIINHNKKVEHHATTVNVYINESVKQKKAAIKAHALAKKIKEAKAHQVDEGKADGLPLPLALRPKGARQQQLAEKHMSKFDQEMDEAKSLLKSSVYIYVYTCIYICSGRSRKNAFCQSGRALLHTHTHTHTHTHAYIFVVIFF
jgi:hypothetical protein